MSGLLVLGCLVLMMAINENFTRPPLHRENRKWLLSLALINLCLSWNLTALTSPALPWGGRLLVTLGLSTLTALVFLSHPPEDPAAGQQPPTVLPELPPHVEPLPWPAEDAPTPDLAEKRAS